MNLRWDGFTRAIISARKIAVFALTAFSFWVASAGGATFTVAASQEIGGATLAVVGELDGVPATVYATGSHPDWTFQWSGIDLLELSSATLTYTRLADTARGTVTWDVGGAQLGNGGGVFRIPAV